MRWDTSDKIALLALFVSVIALVPMIQDLWADFRPKRVGPLEPYVYCFQRGLFGFPSDHLILPLEWENQRDKTVSIRIPYLKISPMDKEDVHYTYTYVAEYSTVFGNQTPEENGFTPNSSLIVNPESVSLGWRVFRIFEYDPNMDLFSFKFVPGGEYKVFIGYEVDGQLIEESSQPLLVLKIPKNELPSKEIKCYNRHPPELLKHISG